MTRKNISSDPMFARDMRHEGYTLLEHSPRRIVSVADLELVPFLKEGEICIGGEELVIRSRGELDTNYGQEDAEWLLEHQDEIPREFRNYYLVFPATVWRRRDGPRFISYLGFGGGQWGAGLDRLEDDFGGYERLVRPRK